MTDQPPTEPGRELEAWLAIRFGWRWEPPYSIRIPGPNPDWPSCGAWIAPDGTWRAGLGWSIDPGLAITEVVKAMEVRGYTYCDIELSPGEAEATFLKPVGLRPPSGKWHDDNPGRAVAGAIALAAADALAEKGVSDER